MVSEPRSAEGLLAREDELQKLDALLDGTSPGHLSSLQTLAGYDARC